MWPLEGQFVFWYIKTWITGDYTGDLFDFDRSPINVSACHKSTSGKRIRAGALTVRKELHNLVAVRKVRELHEYAMRMLEENVRDRRMCLQNWTNCPELSVKHINSEM